MGKPEEYVEGYLRKRTREKGWLCYKFVSPQQRGVPDDIIIGNGVIMFVECKSKDGHLSELQELTIQKMTTQGADCRVVYTRAQVDEIIEEIEANDFELQLDLDAYMKELRHNPTKRHKVVINP